MELKKLLRDLELNKYEASAYLTIIKKGVVEASIISKDGNIPFGKIYESLNTLINKGLIEVQNTRPKKYKIRKPEVALKNYLERKKEESEKDLQKTRDIIAQLEEEINKIITQEPTEKIFWTTAMGEEIEDFVKNNFLEAEKEICMLPYMNNKKGHEKKALLNLPFIMKEIIKSKSRGVKVRALFSKEFSIQQIKNFKKLEVYEEILKNIEIRIQESPLPAPFTLIDSEKVVLRVDDPTDQDKILAMVKISDPRLSRRLKDKFDDMWKLAKPIRMSQ